MFHEKKQLKTSLTVVPAPGNVLRVGAALQLSSILELSETDFLKWVREIESSSLFAKLAKTSGPTSPGGVMPVLCRKGRPGSGYAWRFNLENEALIERAVGTSSVGDILSKRDWLIEIIQRIGADNFERCFLHFDAPSESEASKICSVDSTTCRSIRDFVNEFLISCENMPVSISPGISYRLVAVIAKDRGKFRIEYTSLYYARGRYEVDKNALDRLKNSGVLSREELKKLPPFLRSIELANLKSSGLHRVLDAILRHQREYFQSADPLRLKPLPQRKMAEELKMNPGTLCRTIGGRSLKTPWGHDMAIVEFFPSTRECLVRIVDNILAAPASKYSDREISELIYKRHGLPVSRRSVNLCRNQLKK